MLSTINNDTGYLFEGSARGDRQGDMINHGGVIDGVSETRTLSAQPESWPVYQKTGVN